MILLAVLADFDIAELQITIHVAVASSTLVPARATAMDCTGSVGAKQERRRIP
jgi:hypothetical protein